MRQLLLFKRLRVVDLVPQDEENDVEETSRAPSPAAEPQGSAGGSSQGLDPYCPRDQPHELQRRGSSRTNYDEQRLQVTRVPKPPPSAPPRHLRGRSQWREKSEEPPRRRHDDDRRGQG